MKGNKVYIGSTIMTLAQRKANHKTNKRCTSKILIEEYGWENLIFTVLEECSVEERYERERFHIEKTLNVVNQCIPGKTKEERKQDAKDHYEENRDTIIIKKKEQYHKNWDKYKEYREANKDKLHEYDKKYQEANRERELQRKRDWYYANKAKKESITL